MPVINNVILANSSGSVGIGTYTPTQKLDVIGNTYVSGRLSVATTSTAGSGITVGGSTVLLNFAEIQQGNIFYFYNSGNTTNTQLSQNGTNFYINATGNVGISTTSPTLAKLQVQGNVWAQSFTGSFSGSAAAPGSNTQVIFNSSGSLAASSGFVFTGANVGIGSATPAAKLSVELNGSVNQRLANFRNIGGNSFIEIQSSGTGAIGFWTAADNSFSIYQNATAGTIGTSVLYVSSSGNVGLSTTSANYPLHIERTTSPLTLNLKLNKGSTTSDYAELAFQLWSGAGSGENTFAGAGTSRPSVVLRAINENGGTAAGAFVIGTFTGGATNSTLTEKFRITSDGNVGIGTTIPAYKLEVSGETNSIGGFRYNAVPVIFNSSTDVYANIRVLASYSTFNDGMYINYNSSGSTSAHLRFYANATNERMRIDAASGNVGIATNSPTLAKLQVQGNVWAQSFTGSFSGSSAAPGLNTNVIYNSSGVLAGSNNFVFNGSSIGIGTSSPTAQLHLSGAANIKTTNPANTSGFDIGLLGGSADPGGYIYQRANSYIIFGTNNTQKMLLDVNGNLGIGVTSPLARLHTGINLSDYSSQTFTNTGAIITSIGVDHTASRTNVLSLMRDGTSGVVYAGLAAFDISRWSADSVNARTQLDIRLADTDTATITDVLSLRSNGSVGIGTTAPTQNLQVNGGVYLASSTLGTTARVGIGTTTFSGANPKFGVKNDYADYVVQLEASTTAGASYGLRVLAGTNSSDASFIVSNASNTTNYFTIKGDGNVGIGTTTPVTTLHVSSSAAEAFRITGGTVNGLYSTFFNGTIAPLFLGFGGTLSATATNNDGVIRYNGSNNLIFTSDGTERMRLNANGNLGIGTTTPFRQLAFGAQNNDAILIRRLTTGEGAPSVGTGIAWTWSSAGTDNQTWAAIRVIMPGNSNTNMTFSTTPVGGEGAGLLERMRIADTGYVGIGTTLPEYNLDILSTTTGMLRVKGVGQGYTQASIILQSAASTDSPEVRGLGIYAFNEGVDANWYFGTPYRGGYADSFVVNRKTGSAFQVSAADPLDAINFLIINNAGNVGIGTTTPTTGKVQINTGAANNNAITLQATSQTSITYGLGIDASSNFAIYDNFNSAQRITMNGDGNVGIGTTSPLSRLHITNLAGGSDGLEYQRWSYTAGSVPNYSLILKQTVTANVVRYNFSMINNGIGYNNVLVLDRGNVGIAITDPTTKLQVNGAVSASLFQLGPTQFAARRYSNTVENITTGSYTTLFNVYGDALSSAVRVIIRGTANSVVVDSIIDITANHSEDIVIKSQSGIYTILTIKILAAGTLTEDFTVQAKINYHIDGQPLQAYVDVYPYGNEIIEFNPASIYSVTVLEHECSAGFNHSSIGGTTYFNINNGNVGIGTTIPDAKLRVAGTFNGNQAIFGNVDGRGLEIATALVAGTNDAGSILNARGAGGGTLIFQTDGNNRVRIASDGNVGIGTTNPATKLELQGNGSRLRLSTASDPSIYYFDIESNYDSANTINFYGTGGNNFLKYVYNDGQLLLNPGGGRVGIGTASATGSLQVHGTLSISNNAVIGQGSIYGTSTAGSFSTLKLYDSSTGNTDLNNQTYDIQLLTAGSTKLIVKNNGNVGIGTTNPNTTLQVVGNVRVGAISSTPANHSIDITSGGTANNAYVDFGYYNTFDAAIWFAGYFGDDGGKFKIRDASSGTAADRLSIALSSGIVTINNLAGTGDRIVGTNSSGVLSAITIGSGLSLSGGTLTATGGSAGTVTGTGASTQVSYWTSASNITGSNGFVYDNTNVRVGINVTGPTGKFQVNSNDTPSISGTDPTGAIVIKSTATTALTFGVYEFSPFYGWLQMRHGSIADIPYPLSIQPLGGNVGIGTTSPTAYLDVKGLADTGGAISLQLRSGNSSNNFTSTQITFGFSNTDTYRHAIKTRHNSGAGGGNAIDIYNWYQGVDSSTAIGTQHVMTLDSGKVGIGVTNPSYKLEVITGGNLGFRLQTATSTVGNPQIDLYDSGRTQETVISSFDGTTVGTYIASYSNHPLLLGANAAISPTAKVTISTSGYVGIGTISPVTNLQIANNVSTTGFTNFSNYQILLYQNPAGAASSYGIGIESDTMMFNSDVNYRFYVDNVAKVLINSSGTITAAGDLVAYGSPSDITLKTNIKPLQGALEKITKLQGVSFTWKDSEQTKMTGLKDDIGFIAQEVQEILPELVRENDNGLLSLRDKGIVPYLVEAIKEQQKQIDELRYLLQNK